MFFMLSEAEASAKFYFILLDRWADPSVTLGMEKGFASLLSINKSSREIQSSFLFNNLRIKQK